MELIQAAPIPPFATRIPGRRMEFKSHKTLAAAKSAAVGGDWFEPDRLRGVAEGVFTGHVHVYCLQPGEARYRMWIQVKPGQSRSEHPALMPIARVSVPGASPWYGGTGSAPMRQLRTMALKTLRDMGLTQAQLREKALSGTLDVGELSLWGLISGGFPGGQL